MRKFLLAFLLGFLFVILKAFPCNAQAMPVPDSSVFTAISSSNSNLIDVGFLPQNLKPYKALTETNFNPWNMGYTVLSSVDLDDCSISMLDDDQKSALISSFVVVDVNGTQLSVDDNIYCLDYDNGFFTGQCYIDENGKMLAYTNDVGGKLLQTRFGGGVKSAADWASLFEETAVDIKSDNFILYDNPDYISSAAQTFYTFRGINRYGNPYQACELYIPNQYQKGVVVPNASGGVISSWLANNITDAVIYHKTMGPFDNSAYDIIKFTPGTYTKDGATYRYLISIEQYTDVTQPNNTYDAWLSGSSPNNVVFAVQGNIFNSTLYNQSEGSVAFKPLQVPDGSQVINYNYYYDPTSISRLEESLNDINQRLNENFNNQQSISENNFPFYYPVGDTSADPSPIPFPGIENYPGFEPLPVPNDAPYLDFEVVPQPSEEVAVGSFQNFQVPFIAGLKNRFPFSIPWDVADCLKAIDNLPQAPAWDFEWNITVLNHTYSYHFVGDLSDFDELARIFRLLERISFLLFLMYFSYKQFF